MKTIKIKLFSRVIVLVTALSLAACNGDASDPAETQNPTNTPDILSIPPNQNDSELAESSVISGEAVVTFMYEKVSGMASNQFAVWVEDMDGSYIQTLYATKWTANGGYQSRPDSIKVWVDKSDLASMEKSEVDAIAGATPKAGSLSYYWDLKDADGNAVLRGDYKVFVEGTLRWKNYVLYSGVITLGDTPNTVRKRNISTKLMSVKLH